MGAEGNGKCQGRNTGKESSNRISATHGLKRGTNRLKYPPIRVPAHIREGRYFRERSQPPKERRREGYNQTYRRCGFLYDFKW